MDTMEIDQPERQALLVISGSRLLGVTALDIGRAVCFRGYSLASREEIGRELASRLIDAGLVTIGASGRFIACEKRP
jgi:hypothetical protein